LITLSLLLPPSLPKRGKEQEREDAAGQAIKGRFRGRKQRRGK